MSEEHRPTSYLLHSTHIQGQEILHTLDHQLDLMNRALSQTLHQHGVCWRELSLETPTEHTFMEMLHSTIGRKTEQLISGYQANICRLGALMSCLQSSKSSLQKMSLKRRQFITQDSRIFSGNLRYKKQTWRQQRMYIKNIQESANPSKLITLQTISSWGCAPLVYF